MTNETQAITIALAVGIPLMLAGFYGLKHIKPSVIVRVLIGCGMLIVGIAVVHPLVDGSGELYLHPIRLGMSIALLGLGINQVAAPLRLALGKSV